MTKQHKWTEEERDIVRREYRQTLESRKSIAKMLGVTEFAVAGQIAQMGISKRNDRHPWTPQEDDRLREIMHKYSPQKVSKLMHRSVNSVVVRSKRLGILRRQRTGWFTKREVCEILGKDHKWVQKRIDSGALKATYHHDHRPSKLGGSAWHIEEKDLKNFIRKYPQDLTSSNVDLIMIVEILAGIINNH